MKFMLNVTWVVLFSLLVSAPLYAAELIEEDAAQDELKAREALSASVQAFMDRMHEIDRPTYDFLENRLKQSGAGQAKDVERRVAEALDNDSRYKDAKPEEKAKVRRSLEREKLKEVFDELAVKGEQDSDQAKLLKMWAKTAELVISHHPPVGDPKAIAAAITADLGKYIVGKKLSWQRVADATEKQVAAETRQSRSQGYSLKYERLDRAINDPVSPTGLNSDGHFAPKDTGEKEVLISIRTLLGELNSPNPISGGKTDGTHEPDQIDNYLKPPAEEAMTTVRGLEVALEAETAGRAEGYVYAIKNLRSGVTDNISKGATELDGLNKKIADKRADIAKAKTPDDAENRRKELNGLLSERASLTHSLAGEIKAQHLEDKVADLIEAKDAEDQTREVVAKLFKGEEPTEEKLESALNLGCNCAPYGGPGTVACKVGQRAGRLYGLLKGFLVTGAVVTPAVMVKLADIMKKPMTDEEQKRQDKVVADNEKSKNQGNPHVNETPGTPAHIK